MSCHFYPISIYLKKYIWLDRFKQYFVDKFSIYFIAIFPPVIMKTKL